jgi:chloramphenicol 3-O-phosphotransferase
MRLRDHDPTAGSDDAGVLVITGVMAAGKSTVSELLAQRLERAVHLRGDVFRRMIVAGRAPVTAALGPEASEQLALRRSLATHAAETYRAARFDVVLQDIYLGDALEAVLSDLPTPPVYVVVLAPNPQVVTAREANRDKRGYGAWSVDALCAALEWDTPRVGLWLDTSAHTPEETVTAILDHLPAARVR